MRSDGQVHQWASARAREIRTTESARAGTDTRGVSICLPTSLTSADALVQYPNISAGNESAHVDVFAQNYDRLSEVKAKYDPQLVFRKWFPIVPKGYTGEVPA